MDNLSNALKSGAPVIDVRTFAEYIDGHLPGSINIPLNDIPNRLAEFSQQPKSVIICCASGVRSNKAVNILKQYGVDCIDGGSWINLTHLTGANQ